MWLALVAVPSRPAVGRPSATVEIAMSAATPRDLVRTLLPLAAMVLAACGDAGGDRAITGPSGGPSASCQSTVTLTLAVGQTRSLSAEQAACFTLQASGSTRYVLAGFDTRAVDAARSGPEPSLSSAPSYVLGAGSAPAAAVAPAPRAPLTDVVVRTSSSGAAAAAPFVRATPWKVGERFAIQPLEGNAPATARVVRIHRGHIVIAIIDEQATGHATRFMADVDRALDFMAREGDAVLDAAYGARRPITSAGSGQLLVVLSAWNPDRGAGASISEPLAGGAGPGTVLWMNLDVRPGMREGMDAYDVPSYRLKVLAHELAHAWQARFMWDTRPAGATQSAAIPTWASEGSADLVSLEAVRRYLRVGLTANWNWGAALRDLGDPLVLALEPASARGRLASGYFDASSFMRDLQVRLVRRGMSADAALGEVARGTLEGWFGTDAAGVRRTGLTARMRQAFGPQWDPADAALLWTLAQAADEETSNPELNNHLFRSATDGDARFAWEPAAPDLTAGAAQAHRVTAPAGGVFYVRVRSEGGGIVAARSDLPARWMIARVR